jgi:hypothetical protein
VPRPVQLWFISTIRGRLWRDLGPPDDFLHAEAFNDSIVKLPVWHTADGFDLVTRCAEVFAKVSSHSYELLA